MYRNVERSIALWKAQNGPFRENVGRHIQTDIKPYSPFEVPPAQAFYIDYTHRSCEWV